MKKLLSSILIIGAIVAATHALAAPKAFKLGIQVADGSYCSTQKSGYKYTGTSNITTSGLIPSLWVTDTNGYDPDCMNLDMQVATQTFTSDFRVCLQFADSVALNGDGTIRTLSQVGTMKCTPWASDGGGWSAPATDSNGYDWDAAQVAIETRAMPANAIVISDYRVGGRLCDKNCTDQFGATQYTPWASAGGGKTAWFSDGNWYDSDGGQLILEVAKEMTGCTEPVPAAEQITFNGTNGFRSNLGDSGAPTGWILAPNGSAITSLQLKNGFNDRMIQTISWHGVNNLFSGADVTNVPYAGNKQIVYCPANQVAVGVDLYRGGGDNHERALLCRPVHAGSVNMAAAKEYSINGCGQKYCDPYYNFPTAGSGYVMVGGRFNTDNHKYLASIVIAPVVNQTTRPVECPRTPPIPVPPITPDPTPVPPVNPPVTPTPDPNPNPNPNPNPPTASCSLTATPSTIVVNVGSSNLTWSCTNGPVTISDDNAALNDIGVKPTASGSITVSPDKTTTFTVTSGSVSASATVTVGGSILDETGGL